MLEYLGCAILFRERITLNYDKYKIEPPVVIGRNSRSCSGCIILPYVQLVEYTVVAGADVTKSFLEGDQILAGVLARVMKNLEKFNG